MATPAQKKLVQQRLDDIREAKNARFKWGFSGKTGWDWLQLFLQLLTALALPVALFIATQWFSAQQSAQQAAANSVQARNQQQETTYQAYLDRMSDLIEHGKLADPHSSDAIRALARSQTLATLRRSDATRKGYILLFLHDANLISQPDPIVKLAYADLSFADLSGANLGKAFLYQANLSYADLSGANLGKAFLYQANLSYASLSNADLSNTNLSNANLSNAGLSNADLSNTNLSYANLSNADLSGARNLTQQQLDLVFSCQSATLPQGLTCHRNIRLPF